MAAIYYTENDKETGERKDKLFLNNLRSDTAKRRVAGIKAWNNQLKEWFGEDYKPSRNFYVGKNQKSFVTFPTV